MPIDYVTQLGLFTMIIFAHNACAATQDVAIDAMAVNVLPEHERGVANGFMFAGASIGQAIGGSGVLFLTAIMPFASTYFFVAASILAVTVFVVLPLKEPPGPPRPATGKNPLAAAMSELGRFIREAWRAFTGSRPALVGVIVSLLPFGAYALSLALQSNLAVELGWTTTRSRSSTSRRPWRLPSRASPAAGSPIASGRNSTLALFVFLTVLPTLWLAYAMQQAGWIMPVDMKTPNRQAADAALVHVFWGAVIVFQRVPGPLLRRALRDVHGCHHAGGRGNAVHAYMALSNLVITYTSWWQGNSLVKWGYPITLVIDSVVGLFVLFLLPLMAARKSEPAAGASPRLA
jgi:hypothetical protein